jgi:hypothetical protein
MSDAEEIVSELVRALRSAERLWAGKASALMTASDWSDATFRFEPSEWGRFGSDDSEVGFWGYVDAERAGLGGVVWMIDLIRDGEAWRTSRSLKLNRNTTNYQETVADLPDQTFASSRQLAESLPKLVGELLRLQPPKPDMGS